MKLCHGCDKKFGLLEKIYYDQEDRPFCQDCVKEQKQENEEDDGQYVELKEGPEPSVQHTVDLRENKTDAWEFRVIKLSSEPMQKTSVTIDRFEQTINQMGDDGWELVSVIPLHTLLMKSGMREEPAMIFKRKK